MNGVLGQVLIAAALVALVLLIAYQVYMLYWTKKTSGSVPRTVMVLRITNIVLLVVGTALVLMRLVG